METQRFWLVVFGLASILGAVLWWNRGSTPSSVADTAEVEGQSPAAGAVRDRLAPSARGTSPGGLPGPRTGEPSYPEARSPYRQDAPPPGFGSPSVEELDPMPVPPAASDWQENALPGGPSGAVSPAFDPPPTPPGFEPANPSDYPGAPPPSAFEPLPPQNFENPEFMTPPPPPPQFDGDEMPSFESTEPPLPVDEYYPPASEEDFEPPMRPEDY